MSEQKKQLLLGLTTTAKSDWRDKVKEIDELGLHSIALLPTAINHEERQELYGLLERTKLTDIPYVHLRADFAADEVEYLMKRFKTKIFSAHATPDHLSLLDNLARFASLICIENGDLRKSPLFNKETFTKHQVYGICLDLAHYQSTKDTDKVGHKRLVDMLLTLPIGLNHISAYQHNALGVLFGKRGDSHWADTLSDFDYLKSIPTNYFGKYVVLELENSFLEQQEIAKYLRLLLKDLA